MAAATATTASFSSRNLFTGWRAVAIVLTVFYFGLLLSVSRKSETFDEPGHIAAGYTYWKFNDYRFDPENGTLSKRWMALPFLVSETHFPSSSSIGFQQSSAQFLGFLWLNWSGNDPARIVRLGRAMSGLWAVALGLVIWLWSRQLFGPAGGMLSLLVYVGEPVVVANGALMTSDIATAFLITLATWRIWLVLERVSVGRIAASSVSVSALFLLKASAVVILPIAAVLVAVAVGRHQGIAVGSRVINRRRGRATLVAVLFAWHALVSIAMVWIGYGGRYSAFAAETPGPKNFERPWQWALDVAPYPSLLEKIGVNAEQRQRFISEVEAIGGADLTWSNQLVAAIDTVSARLLDPQRQAGLQYAMDEPARQLLPRLIHAAATDHFLPEAFLYGYATVWRNFGRSYGFLNGQVSATGWKLFFPYAFLVKTRLTTLALFLASFSVLVFATWQLIRVPSLRATVAATAPLWALLLVYWAAALSASLSIGHRHLLPTYPPCFVLCGVLASPMFSGWRKMPLRAAWVGSALVGLGLVETIAFFPDYLAYFNGIVRPTDAHQHMVDSSLDWGQDLPAIADYVRTHPNQLTYLAFFGIADAAAALPTVQPIGGHLDVNWRLQFPFKIVPTRDAQQVATFLRDHPNYDPDFVVPTDSDAGPGCLLLYRPSSFQLRGGTYLISATMLQPNYYSVPGEWSPKHVERFRTFGRIVEPLFSDEPGTRLATLKTRPVAAWPELIAAYYDIRLERLVAYLRKRKPDSELNYTILVFHLTDADVNAALNDPAF